MILQALTALILIAQAAPAAVPAPAPSTTTAPAAEAAPVDPVIAEINRLMESWKGKPGNALRGRLGLSHTTKTATDGEVVYWLTRAESLGCGMDASGAMRCGDAGGGQCAMAVAFSTDGKVMGWHAAGGPEACKNFVAVLARP